MKKTFTIDVTQEDIDLSFALRVSRKLDCSCPIERAASRALKCISDCVSVGIATIQIMLSGEPICGTMPEDAQVFVSDYDRWNSVDPFSFQLTLDIPEAANA